MAKLAFIQLNTNFLFTEVKLKFYGSTQLKLSMFYFKVGDIQGQSLAGTL